MKNKILIITFLILLTIIVFFLIIFLVSYLSGGINLKNEWISIGSKSTTIILDKQFKLEDVKNIEIKQEFGDVIFKETTSNDIQVVCYGKNKNDVQIDLKEGKLDIDYKSKKTFVLFNFGGKGNDIIIYIPSNYSNGIKIKNNYGKCIMTDLESATINIDCDSGNVELGKVKNLIAKCDFGNIKVKEVLNKCDIKADCGNIEINKMEIQENSTIKANFGNVNINDTNDISIDANVDLGKKNINKNNRNVEVVLKINCDCGNITINN